MAGSDATGDQKKAQSENGVVLFEDEASFQLDPTLYRTWARRGFQPRIPTRGERKTAHIYGAIAVMDARFTYAFADVFNGKTFLGFLKLLVTRYVGHKVFLIIDNGPCHNLNVEGKAWLQQNAHLISLHRLPPYSPELNGIEGVWKATRRAATHNRFFANTAERDAALRLTFRAFQRRPSLIDGYVRRFRA